MPRSSGSRRRSTGKGTTQPGTTGHTGHRTAPAGGPSLPLLSLQGRAGAKQELPLHHPRPPAEQRAAHPQEGCAHLHHGRYVRGAARLSVHVGIQKGDQLPLLFREWVAKGRSFVAAAVAQGNGVLGAARTGPELHYCRCAAPLGMSVQSRAEQCSAPGPPALRLPMNPTYSHRFELLWALSTATHVLTFGVPLFPCIWGH